MIPRLENGFPLIRPAGKGPSLSPAEVAARGARRYADALQRAAKTALIAGDADHAIDLQADAEAAIEVAEDLEQGRTAYAPCLHADWYRRGSE
ncbi:MAG: hypothetical protein KBC46_03275 [Ferrovibrio sp.]|nr:hypothetical protein [Ferrovibrio sp.]